MRLIPPVYAPEPSGWHHGHGVDPLPRYLRVRAYRQRARRDGDRYLLEWSSGRTMGERMHAERAIEKREPTHEGRDVKRTTCCIVGGGPAGGVLALLLARSGVNVTLLEAHLDFDREFRGDTIHPSVMEIMNQLGLAERLLELRHTKVRSATVQTVSGPFTPLDFSHLKTRFPYITMMPQTRDRKSVV